MGERKTIGELNGRWAVLLKVNLAAMSILIPLSLSWAIWMTRETFQNKAFRERGDRFTQQDGLIMDRRYDSRLDAVERVQERMLTILERIEAKVNQNEAR